MISNQKTKGGSMRRHLAYGADYGPLGYVVGKTETRLLFVFKKAGELGALLLDEKTLFETDRREPDFTFSDAQRFAGIEPAPAPAEEEDHTGMALRRDGKTWGYGFLP